jgi:hypothetical protein
LVISGLDKGNLKLTIGITTSASANFKATRSTPLVAAGPYRYPYGAIGLKNSAQTDHAAEIIPGTGP